MEHRKDDHSPAARRRVPVALTIAGSDSGGGAGIQADLKTFSALGVYGASALTAITAQNTLGVTAIQELSADVVAAQIDAVVTDIGVDAAKTGMIASSELIETVAAKVRQHRLDKLVVDPVMVAKSGDRLLREDAVTTLRELLVPLALVVTPNLPEASVLLGRPVETPADVRRAAEAIVALGARSVVVKGGHRDGPPTDLFYDGRTFIELPGERVATTSTHGTGCTFSSAITAYLARGLAVEEAVAEAKRYISAALRHAFPLGHGHGPVHHFWQWWPAPGDDR